jgi:hypothetical protein
LALCQMEGRYETMSDGLFEFFAEGAPFYSFSSASAYERIEHLIRNNFDKLIYGVFRTKFLKYQGRKITEWVGTTFNENPLFILIAAQGNIRVLPTVGMFKIAAKAVCEQARWEQTGGRYPNSMGWRAYFHSLLPTRAYHSHVIREMGAAIDTAISDGKQAQVLRRLVRYLIRRHEFYMAVRWKQQPRRWA